MPTKVGRAKRLATLTAVAAGALVAAPGTAFADSCPVLPSTQAFERSGDSARYSLAPGGRFESSLSWTKAGAPSPAPTNIPFNLSGVGLTSARLRGSDAITSAPLCVSGLHPTMRFVTRALDPRSRLTLEVLWTDKGVDKTDILEEHPADLWQAWGPSKVVSLGDKLPTGSGEVHQVRLRFKLKDGVGDWLVDDVHVDPVASR